MFNAIVQTSLQQRWFVLLTSMVVMLAGAWFSRQLPVDVFPDLNRPTVTVMTEVPGMAPEEVEWSVSVPLENAFQGLPGVTRVRSVSGVGLAVHYIEFDWATEIYRNRQMVAERMTVASAELPTVGHAQMAPVASIMGEILLIGLSSDGADMMQVRDVAEFLLRPRLLAIPGVANVIALGGEGREWRVTPDPIKMHALNIELDDVRAALSNFGQNSSGGFLESGSTEYLIRHQGRSRDLADLSHLVITHDDQHPVLLHQIASVTESARVKRGDAGMNAAPAVIVSVQKQPHADTVALTAAIERELAAFNATRADGLAPATVLFRQATFIERSIHNVQEALRDGALMVAVVLLLFLASLRPTMISLMAIPFSLLVTVLVFTAFQLSINTMTLGGLAIAVGELVDDAVVDVENILRRLRERLPKGDSVFQIVRDASIEVRSGIVYATAIVVLVFVPLFALPGIEGRLFVPLGAAYIVAILSSLLVSMTLTPVLCYWLLPKQAREQHQDSWVSRHFKQWDTRVLHWSFRHQSILFASSAGLLIAAGVLLVQLPRSFLPAFNEGTLTIDMQLKPGTSLSESNRIGQLAEKLLLAVDGVSHVGRRTGRAEMDEHAEGVHYTEIDVDLDTTKRDREQVLQNIRAQLSLLPITTNIGQPISHRLDHLLSGVRAEIVFKIYGDDLNVLRGTAEQLRNHLRDIDGLRDLRVEKQVNIPQLLVQLDYQRAAEAGVKISDSLQQLQQLVGGEVLTEIVDGNRRINVTLRLKDEYRSLSGLQQLMVPARDGHVPLTRIATVIEREGPNQIGRDNGRRRIVVSANHEGRSLSAVMHDVEQRLKNFSLPSGYQLALEGQYQAQKQASWRIGGLAFLSFCLIAIVLYQRYRSLRLCAIILMNIPLALVGAVIALALAGETLSVASLVGFITLAGISTRNGILKISHYINLMAHEKMTFNQELIIRGSLERLIPVLMTALTAAFALLPLVFSGDAPGKEILHPVALVIFGGLLSSTLLDTVLTPVFYWRWGQQATENLLENRRTSTIY